MLAAQPNILWICFDQERFDAIGALGNPHVQTPNLELLCAVGMAAETAMTYGRIARLRLIPLLRAGAGHHGGRSGKLHLADARQHTEPRSEDNG